MIVLNRSAIAFMASSIAAFFIAIIETFCLSMLNKTLDDLDYWLSPKPIESALMLTVVVFVLLGVLYFVLSTGFYLMGKKGFAHIGSIVCLLGFIAGVVNLIIPMRLLDTFGKTTLMVLRIVSEIRGFQLILLAAPMVFGFTGMYSAIKSERGAYQLFGFSLVSIGKLGALVALIEGLMNPKSHFIGASLILSGGFHSLLVFLGFVLIGMLFWRRRLEV
ncbi:MAG: hypothetical protein QXJ52_03695 [Candidatus Korarchaeota archaeon]|nr:hypothetical protein [Thermoproteota archaeon]